MEFDKTKESIKFLSKIATSPVPTPTASTWAPTPRQPDPNQGYISKQTAAVSFLGNISTGLSWTNAPIELTDFVVEPKAPDAPQTVVHIPIEMYRQGEVVLPESFFGERLLLTIRGSPLVLFSVIPVREKYKPKRHRGPKTMFGL